jgi:hypothetical protein
MLAIGPKLVFTPTWSYLGTTDQRARRIANVFEHRRMANERRLSCPVSKPEVRAFNEKYPANVQESLHLFRDVE